MSDRPELGTGCLGSPVLQEVAVGESAAHPESVVAEEIVVSLTHGGGLRPSFTVGLPSLGIGLKARHDLLPRPQPGGASAQEEFPGKLKFSPGVKGVIATVVVLLLQQDLSQDFPAVGELVDRGELVVQ